MRDNEDMSDIIVNSAGWACISVIATPSSPKLVHAFLHGTEMIVSLTVITLFAYIDFDCIICAHGETRQAPSNPYIEIFIFGGWIMVGIDFITYGILLFSHKFNGEKWENLPMCCKTFQSGLWATKRIYKEKEQDAEKQNKDQNAKQLELQISTTNNS